MPDDKDLIKILLTDKEKLQNNHRLCGIVQLANSNALRFWNWSFTIKTKGEKNE
jgi:hypothetical protein